MKFLFIPSQCVPFHGKSIDERPLGGTETAVIRLAASLVKLGHDVVVASDIPNPSLSDPLYVPMNSLGFVQGIDVLIGVRDWRMSLYPIPAKKRFFWTGDAYDQPNTVGFGDHRVARKIDRFLAVSNWHADTMCEASGFPVEKSAVIRNGIHLEYFTEAPPKIPKRLIYSSTPYRGLSLLVPIYREILARHPDASLHIYSGYDVYCSGIQSTPPHLIQEFETIRETLSSLPNVNFHGNVMQKNLAKAFLESSILAYPNIFAETSCITAMEAQAAGCIPVTSALGALPETVGEAGILVNEKPGSDAYVRAYIEALDGLLGSEDLQLQYRKRCLDRAPQFGWDVVAQKLLSLTN